MTQHPPRPYKIQIIKDQTFKKKDVLGNAKPWHRYTKLARRKDLQHASIPSLTISSCHCIFRLARLSHAFHMRLIINIISLIGLSILKAVYYCPPAHQQLLTRRQYNNKNFKIFSNSKKAYRREFSKKQQISAYSRIHPKGHTL